MANDSDQDSSELRYFPRWEVQNNVEFRILDNPSLFSGKTKNLSCAGVCIYTDSYLSSEQRIKLKINLSDDDIVELEGDILWVKREDQQYQIGVHFFNTESKAQELILKYAFSFDSSQYRKHLFRDWKN